ncbi:MAG: hypothetical protein ACPGSB_04315 [Opitutales bacterium]
MTTISFPNWSDAFKSSNLPRPERERHRIIINWFLGHLKRGSSPATKASARDFIEHLIEARRPADWQVKQWTDGLNWFFREAPKRRNRMDRVTGRSAWPGRGSPDRRPCLKWRRIIRTRWRSCSRRPRSTRGMRRRCG